MNDSVDDITFEWSMTADCHYPHSMPEYRRESQEGTITAEDFGDALVKIITGLGADVAEAIEWGRVSPDRPITIEIRRAGPLDEASPS